MRIVILALSSCLLASGLRADVVSTRAAESDSPAHGAAVADRLRELGLSASQARERVQRMPRAHLAYYAGSPEALQWSAARDDGDDDLIKREPGDIWLGTLWLAAGAAAIAVPLIVNNQK